MNLPLHAEEFVWDIGQWGLLAAAYLLLALPFLCAATVIGIALLQAGERQLTQREGRNDRAAHQVPER